MTYTHSSIENITDTFWRGITIGMGLIAAIPLYIVVSTGLSYFVGDISPARLILCYQVCVLIHEYTWRKFFDSSFLLE